MVFAAIGERRLQGDPHRTVTAIALREVGRHRGVPGYLGRAL